MAPSDKAQDPTDHPDIPTLIGDYRAHQEALRAQVRDLAQMRGKMLAEAEIELRAVVAATRGEARDILLKARRDLHILTSQVQAALQARPVGEPGAAASQDVAPLGASYLVASAQHDGSAGQGDVDPGIDSPDQDGLLSSPQTQRLSIAHRAPGPVPVAPADGHALTEDPAVPTLTDTSRANEEARARAGDVAETHEEVRVGPMPQAPLAFTADPDVMLRDPEASASPRRAVLVSRDRAKVPRSISAFFVTFCIVGVSLLIATGWWMRRSTSSDNGSPQEVVQPLAANAQTPAANSASSLVVAAPPVRTPPTATPSARQEVAAAPPARTPTTGTQSPRQEVVAAAERWLDAYFRDDQAAMAALADARVSVADERSPSEQRRGPRDVRRALTDVDVQTFGESAIFTARFSERSADTQPPPTQVPNAFVSQIWTHRTGEWRLTDVRIVSSADVIRNLR